MDNDNRRPEDGPEQEYYRRKELDAERDGQERRPDDGPEQEYYRRKGFYDQVNEREKIYERRPSERKLWSRRRMLLMIGIPVLTILLVGALLLQITKRSNISAVATTTAATPIATKITPTVFPTPSPTPLPTLAPPSTTTSAEPPGTLLCDGAVEGWDGWRAAPEWTDQNGILSSAGTSSASTLLITPCNFNTSHYAIETKIQVAETTASSQCFYIGVQGFTYQIDNVPTWAGHEIAINCSGDNTIQLIFADLSAPQNSKVEAQAYFNHGFLYHTYRIEVRQYNFLVFVDGQLLLSYTDDIELASEIALASYHTQVNVSSFQIIAL